MLLVEIADPPVARGRRVEIPRHRVRSRPLPGRLRPRLQGHAEPVADVVARPAHLHGLPARTEIAGAHLGVRLEAARGEHDRARGHLLTPVRSGRAHAPHGSGALVEQKRDRLRAVADLDTSRFAGREERVGEPGPTADGLDDEAAPEAELAADAVGLPAVEQHPADAQGLAHPGHGGPGAIDESVDEPGVGPTAGHADEVAPHCLHGVRAEVDLGELPLAQVGDQPGDVVDPGVRKAEGAAAEVGVAAALLPRRLLQHDRPGSRLPGREGRAERGVPRAHDDDIGIGRHALPPPHAAPLPPRAAR